MKITFLLLFLIGGLTAAAQQEEAAVKQTINQLFDGMRRSDTALMRSSFAPGALLQSVGKNRGGEVAVETEPVDSFLAAVARPHKEVWDERISFDLVKTDGDLAIAWTPYRFYLGDRFSHCGVDSYQLVKIAGAWKIQYLIDTRRRQGCE
jgi:hypothetical protein